MGIVAHSIPAMTSGHVQPVARVEQRQADHEGPQLCPCRNITAISTSFQTQSAWTITTVTSAGTESGSTISQKMRQMPAPSRRAASSNGREMVAKKLAEQEGREGQHDPRVDDDDRVVGVELLDVDHHLEQRDDEDDRRHDQERDQKAEDEWPRGASASGSRDRRPMPPAPSRPAPRPW